MALNNIEQRNLVKQKFKGEKLYDLMCNESFVFSDADACVLCIFPDRFCSSTDTKKIEEHKNMAQIQCVECNRIVPIVFSKEDKCLICNL